MLGKCEFRAKNGDSVEMHRKANPSPRPSGTSRPLANISSARSCSNLRQGVKEKEAEVDFLAERVVDGWAGTWQEHVLDAGVSPYIVTICDLRKPCHGRMQPK